MAPRADRADFGGHQFGEFRALGVEQVGGLEQHGAPLARAERRPGRERRRRGVGGGDGVGDGGRRRARRDVAGERIDPVEGAAVGGADVAIADHQVDVFHDALLSVCNCCNGRVR